MNAVTSPCPGCMLTSSEATSERDQGMQEWVAAFVCGHCSQPPWFVCCQAYCLIPSYKNVFTARKQLRNHAQHWHSRNTDRAVINSCDIGFPPTETFGDSDDQYDHNVDDGDTMVTNASSTFDFGNTGTAQFAAWCIAGGFTQATKCLVLQALLQSPVSLTLQSTINLPPVAIEMFLTIAKLVVTTGQAHHALLSTLLELMMGLIPPKAQTWPIMPTTLPNFQAHVLNPTNQYSLVSLLPIPTSYMLSDESHAYCCLQEIAAYVLLLPRTAGQASIPLRLRQLCQCNKMTQFLSTVPSAASTQCLVSIGLVFWLDGWDPSASSKNNRSPVHTASATLLCIDNITGIPFNARTFPVSCGPGKTDHNVIFQALRISLDKLMAGTDIMWSHYHGCWTTVRARIIAFLMDQPERRGSNSLLGGNSKQHALFGISCNFENLQRNFAACPKCLRAATRYLERGDFTLSMQYACRLCYGFSLSQLMKHGSYLSPCHSKLTTQAPGYALTNKPGSLSFEILVDAWHYAIQQYVHDKHWKKKQVENYFSLLCINKATVDSFTLRCGNYRLVENMAAVPDKYNDDMVAFVNADRTHSPESYLLPPSPPAWSIGTMHQRVETIMHLAMNTQKAVFKLVLHWASGSDNGSVLRKRLQPLVTSVQELRLPYVPCRMFKNERFGGFVAENYRAFTMLSPWLFRCLQDDEFAPKVTVLPSLDKARSKWTIKENTAWLKVRGIKVPANMTAAERTEYVDSYHTSETGLPPILPDITPTPKEIRRLLFLLYRVFALLFATDLKDAEAGNRFDAVVVQFLHCVHHIGHACHPDKKQPIWLTKYGFLGLLRCRQHFLDYTYLHSLYEGGIEGEGMVKELRPLCPNAVRAGWPLNLIKGYNRQNILASLTSGFEASSTADRPTTFQHDANGKRYKSWADVNHAIGGERPLSVVILGTETSWTCHVLIRMFKVTYTKQVMLCPVDPLVDEFGYVYHSTSLGDEHIFDESNSPILSFALMLPCRNNEDNVQFCVVDKEWRFVGTDQNWTYLN